MASRETRLEQALRRNCMCTARTHSLEPACPSPGVRAISGGQNSSARPITFFTAQPTLTRLDISPAKRAACATLAYPDSRTGTNT